MLKCLKNEKLWFAVGGAAAMVIGKKIVKAKKTREEAQRKSEKRLFDRAL